VNLTIFFLIAGVFLFFALYMTLSVVFRRKVDVDGRIRKPLSDGKGELQRLRNLLLGLEGFFKPLGEFIPRSPEEMSRHEKRLVQAGYRRKDAVVLFHGAQVGMALMLIVIAIFTGLLYKNILVGAAVCIFLGVILPDRWLAHKVDTRKDRIQLSLPDALDLAVVCVEAGLGLDQSLMRIAEELQVPHPELSEEFKLRNIEINMGRTRQDAFRNLAERCASDDMKALVAILIQTDRFGTSVATALRVFADSLRLKRRQRARERAAKLPVKMIPVMVVFVFPSIFVVIVGPAAIQIARALLPMLTGG
jgi:tight adherence protein C